MILEQAITILKEHNAWRRGEGKYEGLGVGLPYSPKDIGIAIDTVVDSCNCDKNLQEVAVLKTWQDVARIVMIADEMLDDSWKGIGFEEYYTEVLKRYKEL